MSRKLRFSLGHYYETYSENDELQKGDVIKKIDEYDVRDLRLKNTQVPPILPKSPVPPPLPIEIEDHTKNYPDHFAPAHDYLDEVREERFYLSQPYRTTPLVLPGAKIKKDASLGECYLRHHPNPMVRAPPHHYEVANPEVAMKQKVADTVLQRVLSPNDLPKVVSQQFNTPIGLYSEQNIADTIKCQASAIPKKPGKFDPNQSEAYKALQEEGDDRVQHVSQPTRQGVFSPKVHLYKPARSPVYRPKSPAINVVDQDGEPIHQSNSFKRIMYSVLGQSEF